MYKRRTLDARRLGEEGGGGDALRKNARMQKFFCYSSAMRCDANFDSIYASHSHVALFRTRLLVLRIFLALFITFWCINHEISTRKVEKMRKCEDNAKSVM